VLDPDRLRQQTRARLAQLGFPDSLVHLPILWELDDGYSLRPVEDVIARTVLLNVAVALSFGMPRELAQRWISSNGLENALSPGERAAVGGADDVDLAVFQVEVEAIWAFAWVLSLGDELKPTALCPDDLVHRVPNLKEMEPLQDWQRRASPSLRSPDAVMAELDLHHCMTWGIAEANLKRQTEPNSIPRYAIWQRRRALEFAVAERAWTHDEWDEIDLST
jgi:hypothetical protein